MGYKWEDYGGRKTSISMKVHLEISKWLVDKIINIQNKKEKTLKIGSIAVYQQRHKIFP